MAYNFLSNCNYLIGALSGGLQNGKSYYGTTHAPTLPPWVGDNGSGNYPWGGMTTKHNNPYTDAPHTGVVRSYEWNITRQVIAPDGYEKPVILINDQFPGPLVEANWGDWIEVKVTNNIESTDEGTAIHWHGFLQEGTPFMDGVPGVSQCPIPPGSSFTYKFQASLYGTSWYHSHYSAQYSDGLFGPLVVHGPSSVPYDIDLGPITVGDWWHTGYAEVVEELLAPNATGRAFSDNNLIQGKMNFNCSTKATGDDTPCTEDAGLAKFRLQSGKTHRLRFVNTGSQGFERVSLDGHNFTVIANDFVPIDPYETSVVTLGVGQRVDVLVTANAGGPDSAFWLRANLTTCSGANQPYALASVLYEGADEDTVPQSEAWDVPDPGDCSNDALELTVPEYPIAVPEPSWTHTLDIAIFVNASLQHLWSLGNVSARVDYNAPTLLQAKDGDLNFDPELNIYNLGSNTSVRLIVQNTSPAPHPIHAHGLNMYVLADGDGTYSPDNATLVRTNNPMRRDVQNIRPFGYLVLQLDTHNTGIWPFHCHIAWHASAGFFSQLVFNPDGLPELARSFPDSVTENCRAWDAFTNREVVDQIDSGV
ncbi:multicopper oxidase-domain-containing protein [Xylariales sp. PMI_506]|nr:multicopper oxidase-domain-containing protein [Xylariales sp. PMI_506]